MKIERDKVYLTRCGEKVRVVCVDAPNKLPVVGIHPDGDAYNYQSDGSFFADPDDGESNWDLVSEYVEPPKPREVWVYVDGNYIGSTHTSPDPYPNAKEHAAKLVKFREVIEA